MKVWHQLLPLHSQGLKLVKLVLFGVFSLCAAPEKTKGNYGSTERLNRPGEEPISKEQRLFFLESAYVAVAHRVPVDVLHKVRNDQTE